MLEIITGIPMPKGRHCPTICPVEFNIVRDLRQEDGAITCQIHIKWRYDDDAMHWIGSHAKSNDEDRNEQNESKRNEIDSLHTTGTNGNGIDRNDGDEVMFATPDIMQLSEYIVEAQKHIAERLQDRYVHCM